MVAARISRGIYFSEFSQRVSREDSRKSAVQVE
jgi:hypothetical protein